MARVDPEIIDFHRTDAWPRVKRVLVAGPSVFSLGGLVIGAGFSSHVPHGLRVAFTLAGFALVAGGVVFTMVAMQVILRDDASVTVRTDGLSYVSRGGEAFVPWDAVSAVRWDAAAGAVVVERIAGAPVVIGRRFADIGGPDLARKIEQIRLRSALNMLSRGGP